MHCFEPSPCLGSAKTVGREEIHLSGAEFARNRFKQVFLVVFPVFFSVRNHAEAVNAVRPMAACARSGSARRTGRSHQNGETVTRLVITNLVTPRHKRKVADSSGFPHFSAPRTPSRPTVVRSWPGTSMPGSTRGFPFARLARFSSTNPNPLSGR